RIRSTAIYQALQTIKAGWPGPADPLIAKARNILEAAGFRIDYIAIADADTLEAASPEASSPEAAMPEAVSPEAVSPEAAPPPAATPRAARPGPKHAIALIAAFIGEVRLIDNLLL
ncbi:MAG TPA: pantoate--beta-alanine ligase, partial [Puia sp.]|nr:pantoate--beta-alanine ligase [Puia sp.]